LKALILKPLGPTRLVQSPILPSNIFSPTIEPALGIPMPSTILGLIGNILGVKLDRDVVIKDPLLGLDTLVSELSKKLKLVKGCLFAGPFIKLNISRDRSIISIPIYSKTGTELLDASRIGDIAENLKLCKRCIAGYVKSLLYIGIHLKDYEEKIEERARVAKPGYMFKKLFTYIADVEGKPVDYEYIYVVDPQEEFPQHSVVRLGGEQRQTLLKLVDIDKLEGYTVLKDLLNKLTSLDQASESSTYILLTPAPLLSPHESLYYGEPGLIPENIDVIGVPTDQGVKPYITRIGLGFSEVIGVRRPQLLSLPPGTIIKIRSRSTLQPLISKLVRTGYYQMIELSR